MFLVNNPHDVLQVDVYLESNRVGRTFAHVPGLPGCIVRGETAEEAAAAISDAIKQHLFWLNAHGGRDFQLFRNVHMRVAGALAGGAATGSGSRVALLPTDLIPIEANELEEHLRRLKYFRTDLLEIISRIPVDLMTFRPSRRQRTIREILQHIAGAEQAYLARLFKLSRFQPQETPVQRLRMVREAAYTLLSKCDRTRRNRIVHKAGEPWTLRKVLRRFLEHEREHILEIEWRLHLKGLQFAPSWMIRTARNRELKLAKVFQFR